MGKVVLSPNPIKTAERIDFNGNIINPITKQVVVPREAEYVPPVPQPPPITQPETLQAPMAVDMTKDDPLAIQTQIEQLEANLAKLKEVKKAKIEELKKQVEILEKQ